jgi:hypothetical protein
VSVAPAFFVPRSHEDATPMSADEAERAYEIIRDEAEGKMGDEALPRRVYRLHFNHSEYRDELVAEVGQLDGCLRGTK